MAVDNTHFKGCWRPEEDEALRKSVAIHGEKNWSIVARHFNTLMGRPALLGRAPKQCRSRYLQQLVPGIKTGEWSVEEEEILVDGHRQFGNQWTLIASMLPGRTETAVKNHYNCTARRKVPTDLSRLTVLQRYLAGIGVISLSNVSKAAAKYAAAHGLAAAGSSGNYSAAVAAAGRRSGSGGSRASGSSPLRGRGAQQAAAAAAEFGDSSQPGASAAAAYSPSDYQQAYAAAAFQAYAAMEQHQAAALQQAALQQHGHGLGHSSGGEEGEDDADMAAGAAAGLLQLARAALQAQDGCDGDEPEDEEAEEGVGSGSGEPAGSHRCALSPAKAEHDDAEPDADGDDAAAGDDPSCATKAAGGGGGRSHALSSGWLRPQGGGLCVSVVSGSEESDRTAEGSEEGSPLAEHALKAGKNKRSSPSTATGRSAATTLTGGGGSTASARAAWPGDAPSSATTAGLAHAGLGRRVLDVSEPQLSGITPLSLPPAPASPSPSSAAGGVDVTASAQQMLAVILSAFLGAAADGASAAATPAASSAAVSPAAAALPAASPTALPQAALAALARFMALSAGGSGVPQAGGGGEEADVSSPAAAEATPGGDVSQEMVLAALAGKAGSEAQGAAFSPLLTPQPQAPAAQE